MRPSRHFRHCPRCGAPQAPPPGNVFTCEACGFTLYFSAANSGAVFIERDDRRVLLVRRAKEPGKGKLAPPGGFIDIGETAEDGLRREVREEVGLELTDVRFLCSQLNDYLYKEVEYPVLDLFFRARAVRAETARALDDVDSVLWVAPETIEPGDLAFPSMRAAFSVFMAERRK